MSDSRETYRLQRQALLKANGPVESISCKMIGDRDGWICGICQDPDHPADPAASHWHPLRATVDHIIPPSRGGTHTRDNVQISHWFCNRQKEDGPIPDPEIMRAKLARRLFGTPLPEAMYRAEMPQYPDRRRQAVQEYYLAQAIERGEVAPAPRPRWRNPISWGLLSRRPFAR